MQLGGDNKEPTAPVGETSFDQTSWLVEQQKLQAMFNGLYSNDEDLTQADQDEDEDGADQDTDDQDTVVSELGERVFNGPPEGGYHAWALDANVVSWRPPAMAGSPKVAAAAATSTMEESNHKPKSQLDERIIAQDFAAKAQHLDPLVKSLLFGDVLPADVPVEALMAALGRAHESCAQRATQKDFDVLRVKGALSPTSCLRLREAVDRERCTVADSVDGLPEHQLRLERESLMDLVGDADFARLMALPVDYVHTENELLGGEPVEADVAQKFGRLQEAFVRRYSADTRPWNAFHQDKARITVNVAVSSDADHSGGRLLGVYAGRIHTIEREEGEATVHSSDLFHGVTRMTAGVRYSLILFFDPDGVEEMFHARLAGVKNRKVRRFLAQAFVPPRSADASILDMSKLLLK